MVLFEEVSLSAAVSEVKEREKFPCHTTAKHNLNTAVGRINFTTPELRTNISAFLEAVVDRVSGGLSSSNQQPTVASASGKGVDRSPGALKRASSVIKQIHLSSTQGPSVLLTLSEVY